MHLKTLEINGFKSFATKTVLEFLPPKKEKNSITAIVGPNGSGKSNIADAIRWVMGEQSLKALRGKKSQDIIFTGSDAKGQMGAATVSIALDNTDGRAPIEFEELIITRKLYRSGDNEYLINGKQVRLLDLQLLLAKAQFGQGSYSVISQGTIDRLLLQTPQERKEFFDEASGIKEFQIKRHQAALKLHRTKENIDQAEILLSEITPRLRSLSRQVKKLEERQDVETELRELQEGYYTTLWTYNQSQVDVLKKVLAGVEENYTKTNKNLKVVQEELSGLAKEESRHSVFASLQAEYQEVIRQKNNLERDRAVVSGKLQAEYSKAGKQSISWLENKIETLKGQQADLKAKVEQAEEKLKQTGIEIVAQKGVLEKLTLERTELRGKINNLEYRMSEAKHEQALQQFTNIRAVQAVLEERHQLGMVYGAVAQLGEVDQKYQLAMDVAAGGHIASLVIDNDETGQKCINYLREHQLGVATFLPLSKIKPRLVSQDIEEYKKQKGVHGLASELVKFDDKFADVFSYVFGNTLIVEDINAARQIGIGRVRMVTLDGDVLETSGSMKGGFRKQHQKGLSFSQGSSPYLVQGKLEDWAEEIEGLQSRLERAEVDYNDTQRVLLELESQIQINQGKSELLHGQKQELDKETAALEQELSLQTMSKEEFGEAMKGVVTQKDGLDQEIWSVEEKLSAVQAKIEQFNKEEENKKQRIFALQDAMQAEQSALNKIIEEKNEKRIDLAKLETKQEDLANEVYQEMRTSMESIIKRGAEVVTPAELEAIQVSIQKLKYKLSLIGGIDEEVVDEFAETKERYEELDTQLDDLKKAMTDLEKLVIELDEMMKKKRDKAFKEIKKEFIRYFEILFEGGKADIVELYGIEETGNWKLETPKSFASGQAGELDGVDSVEEVEDKPGAEEKKSKKVKQILQGIDIIASPPGKKIKDIQALSGGEKTLTSIALVCAILRTNPSPFVVLDEVEAALDEANTMRFTKILHELSEESQFILITHNRATMHTADALYGVTMGNDGMSKLLSVKLEESEKV